MAVKIDFQYPPTVGEAVGDIQSIADGAALTIRPPVGETWMITELAFSGAVTINRTDGDNIVEITDEDAAAILEKCDYRVSRSSYLRMINSSGGALVYSYEGYKIRT